MCMLKGHSACALFTMGEDMKKMGLPPFWGAYINCTNVDETTKKAAANGAKVVKEPFDVMDVGRMSVITDPTGAAVSLWQGKKHIGAGVRNETGAMCWNELLTSNVDAAGKFYISTFGYKADAMDMGPMGTYTIFKNGDTQIAGMMALTPDMKGVPSNWLTYFAVADCDASTKRIGELGGKVLMAAHDIPNVGRFAVCQDPQGAVFAVIKLTNPS
jgi:predicted enzyme related to lactoylglutathione lyase